MFRVQPSGKDYVVTVEQAGPDVVIRVNGYGVVTFQANDKVESSVRVSQPMLHELGVAVKVEE